MDADSYKYHIELKRISLSLSNYLLLAVEEKFKFKSH